MKCTTCGEQRNYLHDGECSACRYARLGLCLLCGNTRDRNGTICSECRNERIKTVEAAAGYQSEDVTSAEPRGNSQEVLQHDHDRTVTERLHTFVCMACEKTLTIWQYPAPSRRVCDECKANHTRATKREYMRQYMATKRAEARDDLGSIYNTGRTRQRGRPRKKP